LGKGGGFRKCKESSGWVWGNDECRSKTTRKMDMVEKRDFSRGKLLEKYMAKMLYEWR